MIFTLPQDSITPYEITLTDVQNDFRIVRLRLHAYLSISLFSEFV